MKRQRGVNVNAVRPIMNNNPPNVEDVAAAAMGKKKVKKEGEQKDGGLHIITGINRLVGCLSKH